LAHPGGNVTGTIALPRGVVAKRLGLFKQVVPALRRAGLLLRRGESMNAVFFENMASTAKEADVELRTFEAADAESYEAAFSSAKTASIDAFIVLENGQFFRDAEVIAELALHHRLPLCGDSVMASKGMLLGYGPDPAEMWRNAARFVDKIVRGAKPADIPIEQATTFRTVINLKTAGVLGLDVPPTLLAAADEVIE
jgi:putative ABC transport system substrate-binding protein